MSPEVYFHGPHQPIVALHFCILRFQRLVSVSNSITSPDMCRSLYRPKLMGFLCFLTSFNENTEIKHQICHDEVSSHSFFSSFKHILEGVRRYEGYAT